MTFMPIGPTGRTLAEKSQNAAGGKPGETGAVTLRENSSAIAAWLAGKSPADIDKAAVSRALSHGVNLEVRYEGRYPSGPNGERLPSYQVAVGCRIEGTDSQRQDAIMDLCKFETPPDIRTIEQWLAELSVLVGGRGREGFDAELMVNAYSSRLAEYPADVVRYALLTKSWKWFPTWQELETVCNAKAAPRRHMIAALKTLAPDPEPTRRPPTPEERARIAALIAEQFPNVPSAWRERATDELTKGNCMTGEVGDA